MTKKLNEQYTAAYASLTKCAALSAVLQPHQERVRDRIQNQPGLVVAHGLGTGKTLSSIAAADALGMPTTVVVPAALQANYRKELAQHRNEGDAGMDITSLQRMSRSKIPPDLRDRLLIIDEAHRLREPSGTGRQVFNKLTPSKRLLLTASPVYNHPADMASLVNLAAGEHVLPTDRKHFEKAFTHKEKVSPGFFGRLRGIKPGERKVLTNTKHLKRVLDKWVDFHESDSTTGDFPSSDVKIIKVPMSAKQQEINDGLLSKAPPWIEYKIRRGLPPSKQESHQLNAFLGMQRQLSNSPQAYSEGMSLDEAVSHSPKIQTAANNFMAAVQKNPEHKAVVYSNYLQSGLHPYKHILDKNKIPYGVFSGEMPKHERDQLVKDYNSNKIKALLISTAGAEGLDLKGTRQIQILDPHFNDEKINQVVGRGVRYKSHAHLPELDRNVSVERYIATNKPSRWKFLDNDDELSADQYIHNSAQDKLKLNQQFTDLLRPPKVKGP